MLVKCQTRPWLIIRGFVKNGGIQGGMSWWHPLSDKKGFRFKTSWFSVRKYVMTKKRKVFAYQSVVFRSQKKKNKNKWCHSKMVTPGASRPPISPSDATASDLPFYNIFAKTVPILKFSDYVIACSLWFGSSSQSKILAKPTLLHFNHIAVSTF